MSNVELSGSIVVGPHTVCDSLFPGASSQVALETTPSPKNAPVGTGIKSQNVNSPSGYTALSGLGTSDNVTQGDTLYLRCRSPMWVQLTFYNSIVPESPIVVAFPFMGTLFQEFQQQNYLSSLEIKGVGLVEYLVTGQQ